MRIAIIGSRSIDKFDIGKYLEMTCDEVVSGGASGVDKCAEKFAEDNNIPITVFYPEYKIYGRAAPIIRNKKIVDYADKVVAVWDGRSKGTLSVIEYCKKTGKECFIIRISPHLRGY